MVIHFWKHRLTRAKVMPPKSRMATESHGDEGRSVTSMKMPLPVKSSQTMRPATPERTPEWKPSIKRPTYCTRRVMRPKRRPAERATRALAYAGSTFSSRQMT